MDFITPENYTEILQLVQYVVEIGLNHQIGTEKLIQTKNNNINLIDLPKNRTDFSSLLDEYKEISKKSTNFSSPNFMGFPDCGNSTSAILASILTDFLQQNQINQSFCSVELSKIELQVIKWMREIIGYPTSNSITSALEVGGICTNGGTGSNTTAMLIARNRFYADCAKTGLFQNKKSYVVIPANIGHYSIKESCSWIGMGNNFIEVNTLDYSYDLDELQKVLISHKDEIIAVVAYAGDSRTQTIDNLVKVHNIVKNVSTDIWLHCDACHGFVLGFSSNLKYKINGIELFDSVTIDPHKALFLPYTLSLLLLKDPNNLKFCQSVSELIMSEDLALGQYTPFIGSKRADSLKLYSLIKQLGAIEIGSLIDKRYEMAKKLAELIQKHPRFSLVNNPNYNSVMFVYTGESQKTIEEINSLNKWLYQKMLADKLFYLHQFKIFGSSLFGENKIVYPLRFMSGNPALSTEDLVNMLNYFDNLANSYDKNENE
jgi:L-2,4-diaminobutyrate decarboxylase